MDELTQLVSKPCSPPSIARQESYSHECTNDVLTSLVDDLEYNVSDLHESGVVVGVNPASSQHARMEELKLLKSIRIARKKSVNMSSYERLSDIDANVSQECPKETRKKRHLESMDYLQNPLSSQQAKVEHKARMEELKLLKLDSVSRRKSLGLSPGANSLHANLHPNLVEEGKRTKPLFESMDYLHNPLSSQQAKLEHQARMEEVKLLQLNGITKVKSLNLDTSEGITDIDSFHSSLKSLKEARKKQHLESMEYLHRYQNNEVSSKKLRLQQNDCPPFITPSSSQDGLPELRDSPEPLHANDRDRAVESPSVISATSDDSKGDENQNDVDPHIDGNEILEKSDSHKMEEEYHSDIIVSDQDSTYKICTDDSEWDVKCNEISIEDDNMMIIQDNVQNTIRCDSDSDVISSGMNIDEDRMNDHYSQEVAQENEPAKVVEKRSTISSSQKKNASMSKSRITGNVRPKRATHRSKRRFENYISSSSSNRDASIDSYDSNRANREYRNRHVSDLSSQSSLDSGFHGQPKRKANAVTTESSRSTASNKAANSSRSRSVTSQSSMTSKSTNTSQKSIPVPLYEPLIKKGIRKNTKRDITDGAVCTLKWDPKAHSNLSGCERCLSFATEKELAAYHTNGHHHRIIRTRGGCKKCCKLFPRKCSLPAPRLCQRCFHDTHMMKLW